jgi:beta-N-acetylglucosaminidase
MKRFLSLLVAMMMFVTVMPQMFASAGDDITGHYFETQIRELEAKSIMFGYGNGIYKPDASITRAEFASLVVRVLDTNSTQAASQSASIATYTAAESQFTDVPANEWYFESVTTAAQLGIVGGYPGNVFKPNQSISREEMAVMIVRALDTKGIFSEPANITYNDESKINSIFLDSIKRLAYLSIMNGRDGNIFGPKDASTRGETAGVLSRMLGVISPTQNLEYKVAKLDSNGQPIILREYNDFDSAKASVVDNQLVLQGNTIAYMKTGMAVTNKFTEIYTNANLTGSSRTYITTNVELKYYDSNDLSVEILLGNDKGYVKRTNVNLVPTSLIKGRSYYTAENGNLVHTIYYPLTDKYAKVSEIGKAPSFFTAGTKYYSWNGTQFYNSNGTVAGEAYQYFQHLPLHIKSNYTATDIDRFLKDRYPDSYKAKIPNSPLVGTGADFKEIEALYGVNALYLMAHAIHESAWGTSAIAQDKKNLYGYGAYDSDPYNGAYTYSSFKDSIEDAAIRVTKNYLSPKGSYYYGAVLGHKSIGMNVKYASDAYWGELIAAHMYRADKYLGAKDYGKYNLGVSNISSLNVRSGYGTSYSIIYPMKTIGTPIAYTEKAQKDGALWYRFISDEITNRDGYVYGSGSLGTYVKEISIPK